MLGPQKLVHPGVLVHPVVLLFLWLHHVKKRPRTISRKQVRKQLIEYKQIGKNN